MFFGSNMNLMYVNMYTCTTVFSSTGQTTRETGDRVHLSGQERWEDVFAGVGLWRGIADKA